MDDLPRLNFDYVFIRDHGVKHLLPFLRHLSAETLMIVLSTDWWSVTLEERETCAAELRRRYPDVEVTVPPIGWRYPSTWAKDVEFVDPEPWWWRWWHRA